jgi:hypothetical protein
MGTAQSTFHELKALSIAIPVLEKCSLQYDLSLSVVQRTGLMYTMSIEAGTFKYNRLICSHCNASAKYLRIETTIMLAKEAIGMSNKCHRVLYSRSSSANLDHRLAEQDTQQV